MLIKEFISSVATVISNVANKIGPAVSKFAESFTNFISKLPGAEIFSVIKIAATIIHGICDFIGIKSKDTPEELGVKAEQADKKMEDFDNDTEAYIDYLNNEIQLDKEKMAKLAEDKRAAYKTAGIAIEKKAIEEKLDGISLSPSFIALAAKLYETDKIFQKTDELVTFIKGLKNYGIKDLNDVTEFLMGSGTSDRIKTSDAMKQVLTNSLDKPDADEIIDDMKYHTRNTEE